MSPSLSAAPVLSACQNLRAPSAVRSTSVTTLYSGKTSTVSRSSSSDAVRWLPLRMDTRFAPAVSYTPAQCALLVLGVLSCFFALSLASGLGEDEPEETASRCAARVPFACVTSRTQSFLPVEMTT